MKTRPRRSRGRLLAIAAVAVGAFFAASAAAQAHHINVKKVVEGGAPSNVKFTVTVSKANSTAVDKTWALSHNQTSSNSSSTGQGKKHWIKETQIPAGYEFVSIKCEHRKFNGVPDGSAGQSTQNPQLQVTVKKDRNVFCTVTNRKKPQPPPTGKLIIKKTLVGDPHDGGVTFDFTGALLGEGASVAFNPAGTTSVTTVGNVSTGVQHEVSEEIVPGYAFDRAASTCTNAAQSSFSEDGELTVKVKANKTATCTFVNTTRPRIKVSKDVEGDADGATFPFSLISEATTTPLGDLGHGDSTDWRYLDAGTDYTVAEGGLPEGFAFVSARCVRSEDPIGAPDGQGVSGINLAAGDSAICTFVNRRTTPPVDPPVTPPVDPPVTPPVTPPVDPPVAPPVTPPADVAGTETQTRTVAVLRISKTAPRRARPLQVMTYTIRVRNAGRAVARNVVLSDPLPRGLIYVRSTPRAQLRGRTVTVNLGNLRPSQVRTVRVTVRASANVSGRRVNVASVRAAGLRPVRASAPTVFAPLRRQLLPAVTG